MKLNRQGVLYIQLTLYYIFLPHASPHSYKNKSYRSLCWSHCLSLLVILLMIYTVQQCCGRPIDWLDKFKILSILKTIIFNTEADLYA